MERGLADRVSWSAPVALVALATAITGEVLRTLYPLGYALVDDLGFVVTPVVLVLPFVAPILAPLVRRAGPRGSVAAACAGLVLGRGLLELSPMPTLAAAVVATILCLTAVTVIVGSVLSAPSGGLAVALGTVLGVAVDAMLKLLFAGWDRVWQRSRSGMVTTIAVGVCVVVVAWIWLHRASTERSEPSHGRGRRMFAVVVLWMPTMLFVASPSFVMSSGGLSLGVTTLVMAAAGAAAVIVVGLGGARLRGRWAVPASGVALAILVWVMAVSDGNAVAVLGTGALVALGALLAAILAPEPTHPTSPRTWHTAVGAACGAVTMFVLTLLYPMHYEMPLPIGNRWLPVVAVALATLAGSIGRPHGIDRPGVDLTVVWWCARALLVCGAGVAVLLELRQSTRDDLPVADSSDLRVATFNIDQGLTADGAVDFARTAAAIDGLRVDGAPVQVVALQEVGRGWPLSGMNDFVAWYEHQRGLPVHFVPAADRQFGNAVIARVELRDVHGLALPRGESSMDRSAVVASVPRLGAAEVTVVAIHLAHRNTATGIAARAAQLAALEPFMAGPATVLLGDFNADNQSQGEGLPKVLESPGHPNTLQPLLDAGMTTAQPTDVCTMPTSNENCSDYVFVSADMRVAAVEVRPEQGVGDHRPVVAAVAMSAVPE